ncbi:hypothetical protein Tco_0245723 [Tanacetum coccineum]
MSVRPVWRKKLNYCNTSNEVDVNLPTPMPKLQSPLKEPSQENPPTTHSNNDSLKPHSLSLGDSCDTNVGQALIPLQISLNDEDLIDIDDSSRVLLVKLNDLDSASNMLNATMNSISSSIKTVSPSFKVDKRLIWIEISGLPLCARGSNAFKKVACLFGNFLIFEVEQSTSMCIGRVCISTKSYQPVLEKVKVEIHEETFETQVYEIGTWSINIVDKSLDTSSTEDENEIEKDADSLDDNSIDGLEDVLKNLNNVKEDEESICRISFKDPNNFVKEYIWCDDAFIIVKGNWKNTVGDCYIVNIYGPHDPLAKFVLWNRIHDFMHSNREIQITTLNRMWSDHIPILLHCNERNFGPVPFKIYHSWFNREGFDKLINSELSNFSSLSSHEKLKVLKPKIILWHATLRSNETSQKQDAMKGLKILDEKIEAGYASIEDRDSRIKLLHEIDKLDNFEVMDLIQKARIK